MSILQSGYGPIHYGERRGPPRDCSETERLYRHDTLCSAVTQHDAMTTKATNGLLPYEEAGRAWFQ